MNSDEIYNKMVRGAVKEALSIVCFVLLVVVIAFLLGYRA